MIHGVGLAWIGQVGHVGQVGKRGVNECRP